MPIIKRTSSGYINPGLFFIILLLSACSSFSQETRSQIATTIAANAKLTPFILSTRYFKIAGFQKTPKPGQPVTLYIEGDGFAWIDRYTISDNPTPTDPIALRLAAVDNNPNIIYLARPCQYVTLEAETNCSKTFWTNRRYADAIISSYIEAINQLQKLYKTNGFHLVGYSGGGTIAALLAARRTDILSLRTIAGNLDHVALGKAKNVSPLTGSLNAQNIASKLSALPQVHYSGTNDTVIPEWVSIDFVAAVANPACAAYRRIKNAGHISGWITAWRTLSLQIPTC